MELRTDRIRVESSLLFMAMFSSDRMIMWLFLDQHNWCGLSWNITDILNWPSFIVNFCMVAFLVSKICDNLQW